MKPKTHKLLSILLALVLLCSLAGPLALSARAAGPYNVGLDDIFNGSVTVDKTAAEEGEAVSFTATPAEGYALASVSVYAIDLGQSVEVNWNAETGGFVFLMPASQVQISASFKAPATFTVTFDPNGGTGTMAAQSITEEETWTIPDCEFTPPGGKVFDSWLISPVSGSQPHFPRVGNPGSGLSFGLDHGFDMIAQAQWKDAPAAPVTSYIFKGVSFELTGLNQLTSGSDAGKWTPAFPIDWTKFLVSIDPDADSAIPDSTLVEAHFDFLYTDAACTTILTGDMQDTGTYYLRLVVNNKNAEDHSIDYSSLVSEHCSASVAGYTTSFVSEAATSFAGKDAVEVVFSVTRNSTPVTTYPVWVGGVQVTSANKDDILNDGGKAKYDPTSKTLTLDNPSITTTHGGDAICTESGDLTIKGTATLSASVFSRANLTIDADLTCTRLFSYNDTVIKGGEIKVTAGSGSGIECHAGTLKISGGNVTVTSTGSYGVNTGVKITGGTVNITGKTNGIYTSNYAGNECVNITGGTVTITGTDGDGIYSPSGGVTVSGEDTEVTVNGQTYAVKLKNDLTVSDPLAIVEPEGGEVSTITEDSKTYNVVVSGETPAKTVVIKKAGPTVTTYPVWVGGVQATDANKDDILGDGTASFDPSTNTLTLDGLNVGDGYHASGASIVSTGIDLTVKGSATLSGGGYGIYVIETTEGGGNLTLDGAAITYAVASGSDTGIRADGNISISGGTIDVTAAKNGIYAGGSVTISGSVTATGSECGISAAHGDVTISGGTVTAKSDTVGIEATNGTIKIQNGTTSVTADGAGAAIGAGGITIGDEMMIKEPAGGFVGDITGSRVIKNPDDTTATHAVIVPKEAEKFPVEVVITTHDKDGNVISTVGGTATADKTEVAKGDTITVTVTPNPGFELESIEFSDGVTGGYQAGKETSSTVPNDFTTSTGKLQIDVLFKETAPATTHTVTFDANGHGTAPAAQTVNSGETATEPTAPTESGWTFGGWYTEAACTTAFDFSTAITGDITLYAKWTEESVTPPVPTTYTVTFEVNGGSAVAAQTVNDGEKATKPADPTKSGFVFDGWYADATFSVAFDFSAPITADVTVYAKWKEEAAPGEIVYTIVSGGSSTWTKGSSSGVTIVVKRDPNDEECFSHFASVQIGSTTLASGTDYTAVAGSTVITLNTSALQKLSTGTKTVTINFDDGKATTSLIIKAGSSGISGGTSPKTGDNSNPGLWITVMVLSGLGLGGLVVTDKKRRYVSRH